MTKIKMIHAEKLEVREKIVDPRDGLTKVPLLLFTKRTKTVILLEKEQMQELIDLLDFYVNN